MAGTDWLVSDSEGGSQRAGDATGTSRSARPADAHDDSSRSPRFG